MPKNIAAQVGDIRADFGFSAVVACEIEFYVSGTTQAFWEDFSLRAKAAEIPILKIEKERGENQYEIALAPTDAVSAARDTLQLKALLSEANFAAKPFADQPGSGLHIHVHLADAQGKNVFFKDDESMSDALKFSIGGLLAALPASMPVFAPGAESYVRFTRPDHHTPTTVSWGANNRTCAIRLPDAAKDNKHIEHRVSGADADPEQVITVILAAMHDGLKNKTDPGPQMYGDASLAIYGLPRLISMPQINS